jgi:hypothetical protein
VLDYLHFSSKNHKSTFTLPSWVYSFIVKSKFAFEVVNRMMNSFGFNLGMVWHYDPYHIISKKIISLSYSAYIHHNNPKWKYWLTRIHGRRYNI